MGRRSSTAAGGAGLLVGVVGIVGLVAAACTGGSVPTSSAESGPTVRPDVATPAPVRLSWRELDLPDGASVTAVAPSGRGLVVTGHGGSPAPALWRVDDLRSWQPVPLRPATYYGGRADLVRVAARGSHVVALGRAVGGAHGNPRWTTWTGGPAAVRETVQPFETFGGPSAIGLSDLVAGPAHDLVVGSWAAHGRPAGVATWTSDGDGWTRADAVPGLASTTTDLATPAAAATLVGAVVVAGTTTHLGGGRISDRATVFTVGADGSARRLLLPAAPSTRPDAESSGLAVGCGSDGCLVGGAAAGGLALWEVAAAGTATPRAVDAAAALPAVRRVAVAVEDGRSWVLAEGDDGRVLLRVDDAGARAATAPPGHVVDLVAVDGSLVALTADAAGVRRLWAAQPDGGAEGP